MLGGETPKLINVPILKYQGRSLWGISNMHGTYYPRENRIKNTCVLTTREKPHRYAALLVGCIGFMFLREKNMAMAVSALVQ